MIRGLVHAAGRALTRVLLHPRMRQSKTFVRVYLRLYVLGKRLTERAEVEAIQRLVQPGMIVADIGANVGFYTLLIAARVGPSGRVLAFEPDPFCYSLLRQRVQRAGATNVDTYQLAIGDRAGEATLYCSAYNRADNRLHPSHAEEHIEQYTVQIRTMDDILAETGIASLDAIKIDVQGAEEQVVRGGSKAIGAGLRWMWMEFSPEHLRGAGTDPKGLLVLLESLGMEPFEIDESGGVRRLTNADDYIRRIGPGYGEILATSAASHSELDALSSISGARCASDGS